MQETTTIGGKGHELAPPTCCQSSSPFLASHSCLLLSHSLHTFSCAALDPARADCASSASDSLPDELPESESAVHPDTQTGFLKILGIATASEHVLHLRLNSITKWKKCWYSLLMQYSHKTKNHLSSIPDKFPENPLSMVMLKFHHPSLKNLHPTLPSDVWDWQSLLLSSFACSFHSKIHNLNVSKPV